MPMRAVEKHGAKLWVSDADNITFERLDPASRMLGIVRRKGERDYRAKVYSRYQVPEPGDTDYATYSVCSPGDWWGGGNPECISDNEADAIAYLETCFANNRWPEDA